MSQYSHPENDVMMPLGEAQTAIDRRTTFVQRRFGTTEEVEWYLSDLCGVVSDCYAEAYDGRFMRQESPDDPLDMTFLMYAVKVIADLRSNMVTAGEQPSGALEITTTPVAPSAYFDAYDHFSASVIEPYYEFEGGPDSGEC